jgi:hypothetical protein
MGLEIPYIDTSTKFGEDEQNKFQLSKDEGIVCRCAIKYTMDLKTAESTINYTFIVNRVDNNAAVFQSDPASFHLSQADSDPYLTKQVGTKNIREIPTVKALLKPGAHMLHVKANVNNSPNISATNQFNFTVTP